MATSSKIINASKNISVAASGDNTAIEAVSGQTIEVYSVALTFASAVDVTLKSGSTVLGVFLGVKSIVLDEMLGGKFRYQCAPGEAFVINLSSAVACKGNVWYSQR